MTYLVEAKQWDGRAIAVVRRQAALADLSKIVPAAIGVVWNLIRAQQISGAGRNVAVYFDTKTNLIDIECGVEAPPTFVGNDEVIPSMLPAGLVAHTQHIGDYRLLRQAHAAVRRWCAANHHSLSGLNWEIYGHWNDDPAKVTTNVFYLLDR